MKLNKLHVLLLLLSLLSVKGYSQAVDDIGYTSMNDVLEINLPQFDVSIELPPKVGFKVPLTEGKNIWFKIDRQTYYSYDLAYLDNPKTSYFEFARLQDEKYPMLFYIVPYNRFSEKLLGNSSDKEAKDYYLTEVKKDSIDMLTSIDSNYGEFVGLKVALKKDLICDVYTTFKDGYMFTFRINENASDGSIEKYISIIESFRVKDLSDQREEYEEKIESGYFDSQEEPSEKEITFVAGNTVNQTLFKTPLAGISFAIPRNLKYEIKATSVLESDGNVLNVGIREENLTKENGVNYAFYAQDDRDYSVTMTLLPKQSLDMYDNASLEAMGSSVKYSKLSKVCVDGMTVPALFYGLEGDGSLYLQVPVKDGLLAVSIIGYKLKTREEIDHIVESIKVWDIDKNKYSCKEAMPLAEAFVLKEVELAPLDDIGGKLKSPDLKNNTFETSVKDLGINLALPGKKQGERTIKDLHMDSMIDNQYNRNFNISNDSRFPSFPMAAIDIRLAYIESPKDLKYHAQSYKAYLQSFKNSGKVMMDVVKYNKLQWRLMIVENDGSYFADAQTRLGDYNVSLSLSGVKSLSEIYTFFSYLKAAKLKK